MQSGIMWFDNDPKVDITTKINNAAQYYEKKFSCKPNICFVNPSILPKEMCLHEGIRLLASCAIIPFHFWIGVQEKELV